MTQRYISAFLQQIMKKNQHRFIKSIPGQASGFPVDHPVSGMTENGMMRMIETRIYIGLNDAETREQLYETKKYLGILKNVCRSYHMPFSVDVEEGGYFHENGEYTEETSLVLILIDADWNIVLQIAEDLRTFFRQESVLVTEDHISGCFISELPVHNDQTEDL